MNNFLLEQQQKLERIAILTEFIHSHPEARELKRFAPNAPEQNPVKDVCLQAKNFLSKF